jgi:thiamine-phosphate pyrophosphorylase
MRGLYAIADVDFLTRQRVPPLDFVERVIAARPAALQLRAKSSSARDTLALLSAVRVRCEGTTTVCFANDRPDLALLAGCSGVHLGQADLSPEDARRVAPGLSLGLSSHTFPELDRALASRPAYVAFGPIFATATKLDAEAVVGPEALAEAGRRCRRAGVPLVAIGGLTLARASQVAGVSDAAAVISALWPPGGLAEVEATARQLHLAFGGV